MSRMIKEGDARYGKCPFCGLNRQFTTVEYLERTFYANPDGSKTHAVEAIIHCQRCGASMSKTDIDEDTAMQRAIDEWRRRI